MEGVLVAGRTSRFSILRNSGVKSSHFKSATPTNGSSLSTDLLRLFTVERVQIAGRINTASPCRTGRGKRAVVDLSDPVPNSQQPENKLKHAEKVCTTRDWSNGFGAGIMKFR